VLRVAPGLRAESEIAFPARSWVDSALLFGERLLTAALIAGIAYSVVDGPVRDWLHDRAPVAQANSVPVTEAANVPVAEAPKVAVAKREAATATPRQPPVIERRRPHPELGEALPSINTRPRNVPKAPPPNDYLQPARRFVPAPAPVAEMEPVAAAPIPALDRRPTHLRAPRVGIDTRVVEVFHKEGAWQVADYAAGYLHGTGVPGEGNVVMAGHKGIRGSVFAQLERLKVGDEVFVEAAGQRFRYQVRATGNVWPTQVSIMYPTPMPTLTLLTCTNWDMQRFVVIADLVDSAKLAG
jgi:sortase A